MGLYFPRCFRGQREREQLLPCVVTPSSTGSHTRAWPGEPVGPGGRASSLGLCFGALHCLQG